ncbi:protein MICRORCHIDIA 6-like [Senna tora]|uniref:Protein MICRORCHIDIA 6-like n=1 Tax=Senna tora TaxID=362788 RepID=A0A834X5H9_9FABA|nr:protein MICRORCHIDIA 6-like [Senna tora]
MHGHVEGHRLRYLVLVIRFHRGEPEFDDIESCGTKVIIYNLWFNDDGNLELDFDTDPEDIRIAGDIKKVDVRPAWKEINEQHIANRFQYSLRVYLSILYLRVPENFRIVLRGQVLKPHNIADDLKYPEYILSSYSGEWQTGNGLAYGVMKLKLAPFWRVVSYLDSRGRGVVGILQADFVEPSHNKQDFERTSLFQKLEARLKEMTWEYWDYHCALIGYQEKKKPRVPVTQLESSHHNPPGIEKPLIYAKSPSPVLNKNAAYGKPEHLTPNSQSKSQQGSPTKRKMYELINLEKMKKHATEENVSGVVCSQENIQTLSNPTNQVVDQETINLIQENKKLRAKCLEYEKEEDELNSKVTELRSKVEETQLEYTRLLAELQSIDLEYFTAYPYGGVEGHEVTANCHPVPNFRALHLHGFRASPVN